MKNVAKEVKQLNEQIDSLVSTSGNRAITAEKANREKMIEKMIEKMAAFVAQVSYVVDSLNNLRRDFNERPVRYDADAKLIFVKLTLKSLLHTEVCIWTKVNSWQCPPLISEWVKENLTIFSFVSTTASFAKKFIRDLGAKNELIEKQILDIERLENLVTTLENELETSKIMEEALAIPTGDDEADESKASDECWSCFNSFNRNLSNWIGRDCVFLSKTKYIVFAC